MRVVISNNRKEDNSAIVEITEIKTAKQNEKEQIERPPQQWNVKDWPTEPHPLIQDRKSWWLGFLYDMLLMQVPAYLMLKTGLVILAWKRDRQFHGDYVDEVSTLSKTLVSFNGQMVTIFTIVFATIVSTLVRRYALFKAQKGAYISELEQLQGSTSLPSTLKLIWSLRAFTITSLSLVALWSFYYLGSQASKLEYQLVNSAPNGNLKLSMLARDFPSSFNNDSGTFAGKWNQATLNAFFESAIMSGQTHGTRTGTDMNGHPLLPDILRVLGEPQKFPSGPDIHSGWLNVQHQTELKGYNAYTSWVGPGIAILDTYGVNLAPHIVGSYTLFATSYLAVNCSRPTYESYDDFPGNTLTQTIVSFNMTSTPTNAPKDMYGDPLQQFRFSVRWSDNESMDIVNGSAHLLCNVTSVSVDLQVSCTSSGCVPQAIRYANNTSPQAAIRYGTVFDDGMFASRFMGNLSTLPLNDLDYLWEGLQSMQTQDNVDVGDYDPALDQYNVRFTQYLNTYYLLSQQSLGYIPDASFFNSSIQDPLLVGIPFWGAVIDPHYAISWVWIAIDFTACSILYIAASASWRLRMATVVPDVLGSVSSLTRDNPYLKDTLPDNGTGLDGISRSRKLKKVKFRLGDVSGDGTNVARVGLTVVSRDAATAENGQGTSQQGVAQPMRPGMTMV